MSDPTPVERTPVDAVVDPGETTELLAVATDMVRAIDDLRDEMAGTKRYGQKNRRLIRWIVVTLAVDFVLSVGLGFAIARANTAAQRASRAASATVVACRAGNVARALQTDLWNTILAFPPGVGETPEQAKERQERVTTFRDYIAVAFAPLDCDKP